VDELGATARAKAIRWWLIGELVGEMTADGQLSFTVLALLDWEIIGDAGQFVDAAGRVVA
jgi:hypothetical protein